MRVRDIVNRDLLATCWTWSGGGIPALGREASPIDLRTRLAAVQAAGWRGVDFVHGDLMHIIDRIGVRELSTLLKAYGIETVELEFLANWWTDGELRAASDAVRADLFDAAAVLGATTIKVGGRLDFFGGAERIDAGRFAESFDALATDADRRGLRVALEPMPMSNVATIVEGARLVTEVGNSAGGLAVDTWHVARGGTSYQELVDVLPMEQVFIVELDDADAEVVGSLWEDTLERRRMPGDGALDTAAFVAALHDAGWRGHWGVEIISAELRALPLAAGLQRVREKTDEVIAAAEHVPRFTPSARR